MPEDDLQAIGLLRRRVTEIEAALNDFGRRLALLEERVRMGPRGGGTPPIVRPHHPEDEPEARSTEADKDGD
jgi:hypothetical protein